jgi:hypothetical protein
VVLHVLQREEGEARLQQVQKRFGARILQQPKAQVAASAASSIASDDQQAGWRSYGTT